MYFDIRFEWLDKSIIAITPCLFFDIEIPIALSVNITWLVFVISIGFFTTDEEDFDDTDEEGSDDSDGYV